MKSGFGFRVRLGNPDLGFENLNPDFPIERTLSRRKRLNCSNIITLMIIRENKIKKKRHVFERFWGFKMSVEGGSDRQQAGFLIIAAVGFPHRNVKFC